jgi:hypothetical protein
MPTDVGGVDGHVEGHADVGLGAEVVDLVRLDLVHELGDVVGVAEVAVVELEFGGGVVGVLVEVVDAVGVEG